MKKYSFILIALYAISTISELKCEVICRNELQPCQKNEDCCSQSCQNVDNNTAVCFPEVLAGPDIEENVTTVYNICSYVKPENETVSKTEYEKYGLNAAHGMIESGYSLNVTYQGKTITVRINDQPARGNTTLELSKQAAEELNITGLVNCTIADVEQEEEEEFDILLIAQVLIVTLTLFGVISGI